MSGLKMTLSNAKKEKDSKDWLVNHGQTEGGAFMAGVRVIRPLDVYGQVLPSGTNYVLPEGEVTIYDGNVRYIDEDVFNHDVEQYATRQKQVDKLVKAFLQSGDSICIKYIGYHYDWLKENNPKKDGAEYNALINYMIMDGMNKDSATNRLDKLLPFDGTPDNINSFTNPSSDYTQCLCKLMTVLKYTCVIFMGKDGIKAPDIGASAQYNYNNQNDDASAPAKAEVAKKRFTKLGGVP